MIRIFVIIIDTNSHRSDIAKTAPTTHIRQTEVGY